MKKKIAVCANGWNPEALSRAMEGIRRYAAKEDFDVFTFLCFASYSEHVELTQGELNIYKYLEPEEYDGIIVFSTMLNSVSTAVSLCDKKRNGNVPVISVGMEMDDISSICVGNKRGMRDLVEHLIEVHGVKRIFFVAGTQDHVDSQERLNVTREVMAEHGLTLSDEDVGYGQWSNRHTVDVVNAVIESEKGLPDAFVCANDSMALAVCTELERQRYDVPEDVIVTGFDDTEEGKVFFPALSTVKQDYEELGYRACEMIFQEIGGDAQVKRILVPSRMVIGESCGCDNHREFCEIRRTYCKHSFQRSNDAKLLEQNERLMRERISGVSSYQGMKRSLQAHYLKNHQFEGEGFYLILNAEYFENVMASEKEIWEKGHGDRMEVVLSLRDNVIREGDKVNRKCLVPGYEKLDGKQHVYYFLPLHFYQYNYGYLVFTDQAKILTNGMLYPYLEKLQQSLKLLRINLRLTMLYDKDPMTGLFNRFVYESKAVPLYQESLQTKTPMMVMFVDINYMKRINDKFGHLHGDNAIKTVVAAISANIQKDWIAVRFGGDEFLIIAPNCDGYKAIEVRESILDFLELKNKDITQPYHISVSCGYVITEPEKDNHMSLQDYVKEADRLMYVIKQEVHAKDGKPRMTGS